MTNGLVIAAPRSGSGKTTVTLGLLAALKARGIAIAPAKTGPDYIDTAILSRVAGVDAVNLDPWAMSPARLRALANASASGADLLLVEGVMGLFDGAANGSGSTADLAQTLGLPVVLVVDADRQSQSIAPVVSGFAHWRSGVEIAGLIVNRVTSTRHETMLREALAATGIPILGVLPRRDTMVLPERHLGLVMPAEMAAFDAVVAASAEAVESYVDLNLLLALSSPVASAGAPRPTRVPPLAQRVAVAQDDAFCFIYNHLLRDWRDQGAEISTFSPLRDEYAGKNSEAVFLPGGYPELHGKVLANAANFLAGLIAARDRGALIYGECGGYMVLGQTLTDKSGKTHKMAGLLPVETKIDRPRRTLGYRKLAHASPLPWPARLVGHEFHYSRERVMGDTSLFTATDARDEALPPMGAVVGRVMGSYAHIIDTA